MLCQHDLVTLSHVQNESVFDFTGDLILNSEDNLLQRGLWGLYKLP